MNLTELLTDYVHAAFSGLWIHTVEPDEAEREIVRHARERHWKLAVWDIAGGLRLPSEPRHRVSGHSRRSPGRPARPAGPGGPERHRPAVAAQLPRSSPIPEVVQTAFAQLVAGKEQRTFLVVLSPVVQIPVELEKLFVVLEHPLPDRDQLLAIARELTADTPQDLPTGEDLQRVLDAAAGLTPL